MSVGRTLWMVNVIIISPSAHTACRLALSTAKRCRAPLHTAFPATRRVVELETRESVCMPYMRRARRLGVALSGWRIVCAAREKVVLISVFETRLETLKLWFSIFLEKKVFFSQKKPKRSNSLTYELFRLATIHSQIPKIVSSAFGLKAALVCFPADYRDISCATERPCVKTSPKAPNFQPADLPRSPDATQTQCSHHLAPCNCVYYPKVSKSINYRRRSSQSLQTYQSPPAHKPATVISSRVI